MAAPTHVTAMDTTGLPVPTPCNSDNSTAAGNAALRAAHVLQNSAMALWQIKPKHHQFDHLLKNFVMRISTARLLSLCVHVIALPLSSGACNDGV